MERDVKTATLTEILILAIIQGITEWLPISSSGHLVVVQEYMGLQVPVFFDVVLHIGSLLVVLIVLRSTLYRILRAALHLDFKSEEGRLAAYVVVGSIPTAVLGFLLKDFFESLFTNLLATGTAFIVTGTLLFISERAGNLEKPLDCLDAILVGVAQGIALIPGVSRSGITISTALRIRVRKQMAFTFSFLLFIPAVIGATVLTGLEEQSLATASGDYTSALLGFLTTVIIGYFSLKLLWKILSKGRLHLFAYYCWAIGCIVLLYQAL